MHTVSPCLWEGHTCTVTGVMFTVFTSSLCLGGPAGRGNKNRLPESPHARVYQQIWDTRADKVLGKIVSDMAWCLAESLLGHLEPHLYDLSII